MALLQMSSVPEAIAALVVSVCLCFAEHPYLSNYSISLTLSFYLPIYRQILHNHKFGDSQYLRVSFSSKGVISGSDAGSSVDA